MKAAILTVVGLGVIGTVDNLLRPVFSRIGSLRMPMLVLFVSAFGGLRRPRMHRSLVGLVFAAAVSCTPSSAPTAAPGETSPPPEGGAAQPANGARADLQSPAGVVGTLVFRETAEGLAVDGSITGLTPGGHGCTQRPTTCRRNPPVTRVIASRAA